MPLTGTDFTPRQRQALRAIADLVQPGLTDAQVLAWATQQGVRATMREAHERLRAHVFETSNAANRATLRPIEALLDEEPSG